MLDGDQLYRRTFFFKTETYKKNLLRSTMEHHRLYWLSLMRMENDILFLKTADFKPIIKQFSEKNATNACYKKFVVI